MSKRMAMKNNRTPGEEWIAKWDNHKLMVLATVCESPGVLVPVLESWRDAIVSPMTAEKVAAELDGDGQADVTDVSVLIYDDNVDPDSTAVLKNWAGEMEANGITVTVTACPYKRPDAYARHVWVNSAMERMGRVRSTLLATAVGMGADEALMIDADLVLRNSTIEELVLRKRGLKREGRPVAALSGIYWTRWRNELESHQPHMPQVWDVMPYGFDGVARERMRQLKSGVVVKVGGLGGCTLIDLDLLGKSLFPVVTAYETIPSMRQVLGYWEDKHFCCRLASYGLTMAAVETAGGIYHVYRPEEDLGDRLQQWLDGELKDEPGSEWTKE